MKFLLTIKRNILTIFFLLFLIFLVAYSNNNLIAAKNGLSLWATCVIPSLFPFFIATELLNYTNVAQILGKLLSKIMRPIFNIPGEGAYAFIMGIISGYPVGAKIVSDFYEKGICSKNESERMLAFTNNSGPLFIIGTVGVLLFGNSSIGILLFITHILSSISVGIIFGLKSKFENNSECMHQNFNGISKNSIKLEECSISNLGNIMANSIQKAIFTTLQIGGFVVLFSVILSILNRLNIITNFAKLLTLIRIPDQLSCSLIFGIIELTNGVSLSANLHTKCISLNIILCAFLLGFGGFSILLQVLGIISKVGLSIKKYFYGKFLQGIFAAFYTSIFINNFSIFKFDIPNAVQNFSIKSCSAILFFTTIVFLLPIFVNIKVPFIHNRKFN